MSENSRLWILGAPDPEMEAIEQILRECGETVVYATTGDGERVTAATAYRCPAPEAPEGATVYAVECIDVLPEGWIRIDHHRPGDPGYSRPPEEFLPASSIGQVIADLATQRTWREETPGGSVYFPWEIPIKRAGWRTLPGGSHHDHDSKWGIDEIGEYTEDAYGESGDALVKEMVDEGGYYHVPSIGWVFVASRGGHELGGCVDAIVIPVRFVLCAAADHCLGAAYRGECPGVDPDELMRWRAESRARFQGRNAEQIVEDIERARDLLSDPDTVELAPGIRVADVRGYCVVTHDCGRKELRHEDYMDRVSHKHGCPGSPYTPRQWCNGWIVEPGIPELPDAASREGVAYLATVSVDGSGRECRPKIVLGGCTTPEMVRAFLDHWAPSQGLMDLYGDPQRGFAGGYLSE